MTEIYLLLGIFALIFNYATDQICNLNQLRQADDIKLVFCSYYEWFDSCLLFFFSLQGFIGIYWQESSYNSVVGRKNVTLHQLPQSLGVKPSRGTSSFALDCASSPLMDVFCPP